MNIILKHRIKLIRAMLEAKKSFASYGIKALIDECITTIRKDNQGWFLSLSEDDFSRVSYASKKEDKFNQKNRVKTTLQRFFRRQLAISVDVFSESYLDKFCNLVSLFTDESLDTKVKIISGHQISNFYENTIIKSCMTGTCGSFKTSVYSLNPDKIKMAIFANEVRALLWLCDDGKYVLDRCYPSGHWGVAFLRAWASKKGYLLRNVPDAVTDNYNNGISDGKNHIVSIKHEGLFPYVDTFKYAVVGNGTALLSNNPTFGTAVLTNTDGRFYKKELCTYCGNISAAPYYINNGTGSNNILVCKECLDKLSFSCVVCRNNFMNKLRYRTWNMCNECHSYIKGFSVHNKCSCYSCADKKRAYATIIKAESIKENKKTNLQMSFEFAD